MLKESKYICPFLFKFSGLWSTREIETNANKEVYVRTTIRELIIYMIFLVVLTFRKYDNPRTAVDMSLDNQAYLLLLKISEQTK